MVRAHGVSEVVGDVGGEIHGIIAEALRGVGGLLLASGQLLGVLVVVVVVVHVVVGHGGQSHGVGDGEAESDEGGDLELHDGGVCGSAAMDGETVGVHTDLL
jgi:hypothetical protein